ncbi:MAG TPA: hypothetical protein DDW95_08080 [Alphaproteobacteria bacterium]|nr:hypothetical protein [Alphaproteobacteria bacterium]
MEPKLFKYIWRYSRREQLVVLGLVLASLPFYYLSLDLPRLIVNRPIRGEGFEGPEATQRFLDFTLAVPGFLQDLLGTGQWVLFEGFALERIPYLLTLSCALLGLVAINGLFKFQINTLKGRMGERMLRRLRYQLFDRVLRFPTPYIRRIKQAEIATMIKDEVEPLGGFIGDAFVQPAFLGGLALTALIFIMLQSFWLGLVAAAVVLVQAFLIPKLRRRILELGRQRQLAARALSGRIGEVVEGAVEIHAHDTSNFERAEITRRLGDIFLIRFELYRRKFFVKFLNNFLAQVTPFIFYAGGGYLAITGQMDIGQLVAALVAYKELPGPVKELIDWDQQRLDVQIKYDQVVEQFHPPQMLESRMQDPARHRTDPFEGEIAASNLTWEDDCGVKIIDGISFRFDANAHIAIAGPAGGGKETLALLLARLLFPSSGKLTIGGHDVTELPEAVTGRRISYVAGDSNFFPLSIRDNLLYGLKHRPVDKLDAQPDDPKIAELARAETARAGNPDFNIFAEWVDYAAAGAVGPYDIDGKLREITKRVALDDDIYQFGLRGTINPDAHPELTANLLIARQLLAQMLREPGYDGLIEPFDPHAYNHNATLGENLLFGTPTGTKLDPRHFTEDSVMRNFLVRVGLWDTLIEMGAVIAQTMVELFADLNPGHPFFEQYSFIAADDLPVFAEIVGRLRKLELTGLPETDRLALGNLPIGYIEARHRLGLIDAAMEEKILAARRQLTRDLPPDYLAAIEFYDPERYNSAASLMDNILFGRPVYGQAEAQSRIARLIAEVLDELNLRGEIFRVGLDFETGLGGKLLAAGQRQKLALARALLRQSDILIVNEALSAIDPASQAQIRDNIRSDYRGRGLIWVAAHREEAREFEHLLYIEDGKLCTPPDTAPDHDMTGGITAAQTGAA